MNKTTGIIIIFVAVAISFYLGTLYQKRTVTEAFGQNMRAGSMNQRPGARMGNTGFVVGSVLSKDATSITVGIQGGGSKILLISTSTIFSKTTEGSAGDITSGLEITANGTPNADGSITTKSVQIQRTRPLEPRTN